MGFKLRRKVIILPVTGHSVLLEVTVEQGIDHRDDAEGQKVLEEELAILVTRFGMICR